MGVEGLNEGSQIRTLTGALQATEGQQSRVGPVDGSQGMHRTGTSKDPEEERGSGLDDGAPGTNATCFDGKQ